MKTDKIPVRLAVDRWDATISPYVIRIDPDHAQQVEWMCKDGELRIEFPEGRCPFEGRGSYASKKPGAPILSGPLRDGLVKGERFPYDITLRTIKRGIELRLPSGVVLVAPGFSSKAIPVNILLNEDGTLRVDQEEVTASRPKDDRIEWHCEFAKEFRILFKNGSPFVDDTFTGAQVRPSRSSAWVSTPVIGRYAYCVEVELADGTKLTLDPGVVVEDGGGDDGAL